MKNNYGIADKFGIVDLETLLEKIGDNLVKTQIRMRDGQDLEKNNFIVNMRFKELINLLGKDNRYITVIEEKDGYLLNSCKLLDENSVTEYKIIEVL